MTAWLFIGTASTRRFQPRRTGSFTVEPCMNRGFDGAVTKVFMCKKGPMSRSLLQEDRSAKHVLLTLKQLLNVDIRDARLIVWFCICTFLAAGSMPVGQRLYGLKGTALSVLCLYAFWHGRIRNFIRPFVGRGWLKVSPWHSAKFSPLPPYSCIKSAAFCAQIGRRPWYMSSSPSYKDGLLTRDKAGRVI